MIKFDFINGKYVAEEIARNVVRHVSEMEDQNDYGAPNIDWDYYLAMCHAGNCHVLTMRDGEKLVGYAVMMFNNDPRHKDRYEAMCEGLFVEKEYRRKYGAKMIKRLCEYMKKIKVDAHILISDERIGRLLSRYGFRETKKLWSFSA